MNMSVQEEVQAPASTPKAPLTLKEVKELLLRPIVSDSPISWQVLGICSALAVSALVKTSVVMSLARRAAIGKSSVGVDDRLTALKSKMGIP